MAKPHPLDNLIKWFHHDRWSEHANAAFSEFFGELLADYDIDYKTASTVLGAAASSSMWGCYFEAAVTRPCEESDEGSILADYLKRRGWKEPASTRRYMQALGHSVFSLHEVVDVTPGESVLLKDVLIGGEPVLAIERSASTSLSVGEFLAARVVELGGRYELTAGLFRMSAKTAATTTAFALPALAQMEHTMAQMDEVKGMSPGEATELGKRIFLDTNVSSMVQLWLDEALSRFLQKLPPPSLNDDDEPLVFVRLSYPLLSPENAETVTDRLDKARFLVVGGGDADWHWLREQDVSAERDGMDAEGYRQRERLMVELDDGTKALGRLELSDDSLDVAVNSRRRAEKIQLLLAPVVAGLIGPVSIEEQTADELFGRLDDDLDDAASQPPTTSRLAS